MTLCPVCGAYLTPEDMDSEQSVSPLGRVHRDCKAEAEQEYADYCADMDAMETYEVNQKERDL